LGATFAAAIAVLGAAFGISKIGKATMEASARQPEISDKLRTTMIIAAALIEGVALFAVAVCFMAL
jgi:F-type H+-transporting ATPase subunit c